MSETATFARVIDLKSPVSIPSTFVQLIDDNERRNAVIIYSPTSGHLIRIFFTNASEIFKVEAKIGGLDHEFLGSLGGFLAAYGITPLYTTGFCKDPCLYEGYFEKDTLKISLEEFKTHFSNLKGVSDVRIMLFQV